jgi:glycosyltransferase involved in cell wall biosynthesis
VHADCGEGALLEALLGRGARAHGVEPRGAVALRALERGRDVIIAEASEYLAGQAEGSLGGIVLSGVVDRLALHDLLPLLARCRQVLARGAPLVVVAETLVVNYHNITPPELMAPWDSHLALGQQRAQDDLRLLARRTSLAVADSAYNEAHLVAAGFAPTAVVPPSAALDQAADPVPALTEEGTGHTAGARWLAVGRVSPNKALESTIAALAVARAHDDPQATLLIVGKPATASYAAALRRYVAEIGLSGAVRFTGHAGDATVAAAYVGADVLVVTSEHEGFCVPVVEAMAESLPVVAFDRGAVPEVLGDAGVLVSDKNPYALAASIAGILADAARRDALARAGRQRLRQLDLAGAADRFASIVARLAGTVAPLAGTVAPLAGTVAS